MKKSLRIIFAVVLLWGTMECWARWRYDLSNVWLPMGLRKNLSYSALESHRLLPNKNISSRAGVPFVTDALGFRTFTGGGEAKPWGGASPNATTLLLGGDSIAFGMYLPYEASLGYFLERSLIQKGTMVEVKVSALPGGSQAMSRELLFSSDALAKRSGAKFLLHSVNHYDGTDNWLYGLDQKEREGWRGELRSMKTILGPYWIQMLQLKLRAFLQKDERGDLLLYADDISPRTHRWRYTQKALEELLVACREEQIQLLLFFMPDTGELNSLGWDHVQEIQSWCKEQGVPFLNLERQMEVSSLTQVREVFRRDGIHLTAEGAELCGQMLADFVARQVR